MPVMTRQPRPTPSQTADYVIVLALGNGSDPRGLALARDADQATVAFHTILSRLRRKRQHGELQLCDLRAEGQVMLRTPLVEGEMWQ
jgi:hypothetical protein